MSLSYTTNSEDAVAASMCRTLLRTTENTIPFIAQRHVPFTLTPNQSRRAVFTSELRVHGQFKTYMKAKARVSKIRKSFLYDLIIGQWTVCLDILT